ncbi:MAG: hypothetical protein KJ856_02710 [Gammaproteobacteria bacterium]|jgi:hypothetical protein|nr:hypothetical protein [Gammaproteobacteria bacterium]MBU1476242.1 hypothetical protein [Gammaproteobacteria bacterium]MBU2132124.1 hypothetical protein [Gammaproteobacteria bacterium]MBU2185935.1 hypothetical protein [Gammaproteobacteria bacterium]MBU2299044.1 hypothetical protein [Gammaproteobacteria bacterium]
MDFGSKFSGWEHLLLYSVAGAVFVLLLWGLAKLVRWAKRMPAGAYFILALFPLVSLFPIPPSEIKKLQLIKQEQVKRKQESGDPPSDDEPTPP